MGVSRNARAKSWGRAVENRALASLRAVWPDMKRTGSTAYTKAAADLVTGPRDVVVQVKGRQQTWVGKVLRQLKATEPDARLHLVVTQDKHSRPLIVLDLDTFVKLVNVREAAQW